MKPKKMPEKSIFIEYFNAFWQNHCHCHCATICRSNEFAAKHFMSRVWHIQSIEYNSDDYCCPPDSSQFELIRSEWLIMVHMIHGTMKIDGFVFALFFFLFRTFQPIFMEFRPKWFKNIKAYNIRLYMCNLIYILCSELFSWKHRTNKSATTTKKESKSLWWMECDGQFLFCGSLAILTTTQKKTRILLIDRQIEWYSVDNCCYGTLSLVSMLEKPQSASFSLVNVNTTKLSANQYGVNPCDDH